MMVASWLWLRITDLFALTLACQSYARLLRRVLERYQVSTVQVTVADFFCTWTLVIITPDLTAVFCHHFLIWCFCFIGSRKYFKEGDKSFIQSRSEPIQRYVVRSLYLVPLSRASDWFQAAFHSPSLFCAISWEHTKGNYSSVTSQIKSLEYAHFPGPYSPS